MIPNFCPNLRPDVRTSVNGALTIPAPRFIIAEDVDHVPGLGVLFEPVEIGGLDIKPGDLRHGDQHGIVSIPFSVVEEVPRVAAAMLETAKELIDFCSSPDFSFQQLSEKLQSVSAKVGKPNQDPK